MAAVVVVVVVQSTGLVICPGSAAARGMDRAEGREGAAGPRRPRSDLSLYLTVAAPIFFALFFVEYLPLFAVGYWSWGGFVHKVLSGIFLLLNLGIAEYSVRRSRRRHGARARSGGPAPEGGG